MIQGIKQLLLLLQAIFRLFGDRQLLEAGKAQQRDTMPTIKEIEAHNSKWVCVCENDCPNKTVVN